MGDGMNDIQYWCRHRFSVGILLYNLNERRTEMRWGQCRREIDRHTDIQGDSEGATDGRTETSGGEQSTNGKNMSQDLL